MASLPVCSVIRLPFWRLVLGLLAPLAIAVWMLVPSRHIIRVEAVDWAARHARAVEKTPTDRMIDSLLPAPRQVTADLAAYVAGEVEGRSQPVAGVEWTALHAALVAARSDAAAPQAWRRGSGIEERRFSFRRDEPPFAGVTIDEKNLYLIAGGDAVRGTLMVVDCGLDDALGKAPARVLLPNLAHAPLALLAAALLFWLGYWTGRLRAERPGTGCRGCSGPLTAEARFCQVCGTPVGEGATPPAGELAWAARIPVINRFFAGDLLRWLGLTVLLVALIAGGIGLNLDRDAFRGIAGLFVAVGVLFLGIMLFSTCIFILIGWRSAFAVDAEGAGIAATGLTRQAGLAIAAAAVGGGLVRGNLAAIGAGVGSLRQGDHIAWKEVRAVTGYPRQHTVALANSWRTVVRLHCPNEEAYRVVLAAARAQTLAAGGTLTRGPSWLATVVLPILILAAAGLYARLWL